MSYSLINITREGKQYDITQLVTNLSWGGDAREAARRLEFEIVYGDNAYIPKYKPPTGSYVILRNSQNIELFRGVVWEPENESGKTNSRRMTCFDNGIYLTHNEAAYKFVKMSPEAMIKKICSDFNIPVGTITATGITLSKLILRNSNEGMTLWDMIVTILTEARKRTGKKYRAVIKQGKLCVEEAGKNVQRYILTAEQNLIRASYKESLENMRNRVVIVNEKGQKLADIRNKKLISRYGMLQAYRQENVKSAEAQKIAKNLLSELGTLTQEWEVEALGIDEVEAGQMIEIYEPVTGIVGKYYVLTDEHKLDNGVHTMSLELNLQAMVASKEAESA